ncbi:hypothetical protein [Streptomyces olivoreticuli]|uniref:hypothetical protein n=1 Tax=Streptomyces olivoreticuli TaxID=68246 RepID=UPI001F07A872|nr:hypothetical protein [Streptomyces olivoreticuli]
MRSVIRPARVCNRAESAAALVLALSYPLLALSALLPAPLTFMAVCCASYGSDHILRRRGSHLIDRFDKAAFGLAHRFLLRQLLLVLLVARMGDLSTVYILLGCLIPFQGLQALHNTLTTLIRIRRKLPVATRNIDLGALRIPNAPPGFLLNRSKAKAAHLDLPLVTGALLAAVTGTGGYATAGAAVTGVAALARTAALVPWLRPDRLPPRPEAVLAEIDAWLGDHRPQTVLYFSGSKDSAHQVNMWLETMAHQHGRLLVPTAVQPWDGAPRRLPTVLYAPTWGGRDGRSSNTSLMSTGENIVRRLLEAPRPVRVFYRPHPSPVPAALGPRRPICASRP